MRHFLIACFLLIGFSAAAFGQPVDTLSGHITADTTLISTKLYVLKGFVYVDSLVTMTIEPGTVIIGEQSTKGTLIVQRGAKIIAQGTPTKPIIFTSQNPPGRRARRRLGRRHHPRQRHHQRPRRRRRHRRRRRLRSTAAPTTPTRAACSATSASSFPASRSCPTTKSTASPWAASVAAPSSTTSRSATAATIRSSGSAGP